ncbi:catalase [Alkalibacillus filiformis]|uniref:Catalase n=1 Tax=Alkalibacillus filiformis TaxID=200990 RepID=A0ABU0DQY8_9BACI|nr:catalase [Alkalibacillus filiformis]MDQ0350728.1 catalase [Alkalibacillus filiformis]
MPDDQNNQQDAKNEQLNAFKNSNQSEKLSTNQGAKLSDTSQSLTAGERGPTIMEDFHFREKMTHFDHERIPERVVHARGFGAHGYFQPYESMKELTKAKFLQDPSVKTPVFVRFSTVVGSRGSADTVRDVRGFATKFYTEDGNFDLVGNNMPIFFIQDAIKFPDLVHAIKPEPDNEIPQASAAHDTFWDWVVQNRESAHMIMWLLSDRGIPRSFRMMEGFGVHTFRLVNEQGQAKFVKFHWKPLLGTHSLTWDEAQKIAGKNPDYHRQDLWEAINNGEYPEFELGIQVIEENQEFDFDFDILDPTKIWPEEQIPVKIIGKMTLNRNQDNFFAETEQAAFHMGNIVPGIDFTNDPLLQGRLFSYLDTQLLRLGGPNFHEIPINRPIVPVHNNQRDGFHRMTINKGKVAYSPNGLQNNDPKTSSFAEGGFEHYQEKVDGYKVRKRSESFKDHYTQATLFYNSMTEHEKRHIHKAFHFEVGNVKDPKIKQQVVEMFSNVSHTLANEIAKGVGVEPPQSNNQEPQVTPSPALSQLQTTFSSNTRKVAILLADGFKNKELQEMVTTLRNNDIHVEVVSKTLGKLHSDQNEPVDVHKNYSTTHSVMYDGIFIPGGKQHVDQLMTHKEAKDFIKDTFAHAKTIAASNDAVDLFSTVLPQSTLLATKQSNNELFNDHGVVTIQSEQLQDFSQTFLEQLAQHRHWDRELQDEKQA